MNDKNRKKLLIGACAFIFIGIIAIAYATFTGNLNINGTGVNRKSNFDIYFNNVSNFITTGTASVVDEHPTSKTHTTIIEDYEATLITPGDSIYFTFDIVNDGDYDATLKGLTLGPVKCSVNGDESDQSAQNVCDNIEYTMKYTDNNQNVSTSDKLLSKETKNVKVTLTYKDTITADKLPTSNVSITNLGIELVYEADQTAKTNSDGSTPLITYDEYSIGDTFTLNGDSFHIIADSGSAQDYVVALKDNALKATEIEAAGGTVTFTFSDENGTGGMKYHTSSNLYETSAVKAVVDAWATSKFTNGELASVDGYCVRLITLDELIRNFEYTYAQISPSDIGYKKADEAPSWLFNSDYYYRTMSSDDDSSSYVWGIDRDGSVKKFHIFAGAAVRPVINVYKSKL